MKGFHVADDTKSDGRSSKEETVMPSDPIAAASGSVTARPFKEGAAADVPDEVSSLEDLMKGATSGADKAAAVAVGDVSKGDRVGQNDPASQNADVAVAPAVPPTRSRWKGIMLGVLFGMVAGMVGLYFLQFKGFLNTGEMPFAKWIPGQMPEQSKVCDLAAVAAPDALFGSGEIRVLVTALAGSGHDVGQIHPKQAFENTQMSGMAYATMPCALIGGQDDPLLGGFEVGAQRAGALAQQLSADLVLWGEAQGKGMREIVLSHPLGIDRHALRHRVLRLPVTPSEGDGTLGPIQSDILEAAIFAAAHFVPNPSQEALSSARAMLATLEGYRDTPERSEAAGDDGLVTADLHRLIGDFYALIARVEGEEATFDAAIAAYNQALEDVDRAISPTAWMQIQSDLGSVQQAVGKRYNRMQSLGAAIDAYRAALSETTKGAAGFEWARLRVNIGSSLVFIGQQEESASRLIAATEAYRDALEFRTRDQTPLQWAALQHNLGSAYQTIGQFTSVPNWLEQAADAYRLALQVRTVEQSAEGFALTQTNLGATLTVLGLRTGSAEFLQGAVEAYRAALGALEEDKAAGLHATVQHSLGNVLVALAKYKDSDSNLSAAADAYRNAAKHYDRESQPLRWAINQNNLANALRLLGTSHEQIDALKEAIALYEEALPILSERASSYAESVIQNLAQAQQALVQAEE